jgi:hypothetical protein
MKLHLGMYCEAAHFPSKELLGKGCVLLHGVQQAEFYHYLFLKRFTARTVYTECTRINYRIVPVNILKKYLHYNVRGTEEHVYKYRCK